MADMLIETVARAICKSRTCEGVACCQWPAQGGRTYCPVKLGNYDDAARAAIEAMREPTPDMRIAGGIAWSSALPDAETYVDTADACYKARYDVAISSGKCDG